MLYVTMILVGYYLGAMCFICKDDISSRGVVQTQHHCPLCPNLPLTVKPPGKLVKHIAMHILHDLMVNALADFVVGQEMHVLSTLQRVKDHRVLIMLISRSHAARMGMSSNSR